MNIIILNINNIFNILFKYKYNYFIKLYLNNYIKIYKILVYFIKYYFIYNKNINKHTKNKSFINFSNRKVRIQKGSGKARLGSLSSPICKQGACSFGPFYINNFIKYNKFNYKLVLIYLFINKRSNIIIIKLEYLLGILYIIICNKKYNINNLYDLIFYILYFKGINNKKKYIILNFNKNYFNIMNKFSKYIILNFIIYNYIVIIV